jgi:predicted nucleic acid-binding Zn ribbon protein
VTNSDLPQRLKDLLAGVGAKVGLEDARATGMLWSHWPEVVGGTIAENAEPTSLKGGVLRIRATSPAWAQELTYLATEIKTRANAMTGSEVVREVRVWTGPGAVARATPRPIPEAQDGLAPEASDPASGGSPEDLEKAFLRARRAWARRRSNRGPERPS